VAEGGRRNPFVGTDQEAVDGLDRLLREAVALRMIADVPLGAFLSGGIDSSTVVALMQAQTDRPVKTFSIGTYDPELDEAQDARAVARHLGTDHTELYVTPEDARDVIPGLSSIYDEPFADSSQIPTYLVSKLARTAVTVALSGDGGDELFAGYNRHVWVPSLWRRLGWIPAGLRQTAAGALASRSPQEWNRSYRQIDQLLPGRFRHRMPGDKLHKLSSVLAEPTAHSMYRRLTSHWPDPGRVVVGAIEPPTRITDEASHARLADVAERMLYLDLVTYMPDDILTKVDRASMAVALEARVPLLDHRVVEFAWRLPHAMKIRQGRSKWVLREVLRRYVPDHLIERPKMGFGIPVGTWLRGPLRQWAEDLLDRRRLVDEGFFRADAIREKWSEHLSGRRNWDGQLWDALMFQSWYASQTRSIKTVDDPPARSRLSTDVIPGDGTLTRTTV
jgi:asparagine synthase (glutamine-hydrolysing)